MPGGQARYWSVCENDPATQRFIACTNDDRVVIGPDGMVTYVVSTPARRPANATAACGVNWLPFGPNARGVLPPHAPRPGLCPVHPTRQRRSRGGHHG